MDIVKKLGSNSDMSEVIFADHWKYTTLQEEVSRGAALRLQKPQTSINNPFYDNINVKHDLPSTSKGNQLEQIYSSRPFCKSRKLKKVKSPKRCPLRVAEIAAPTKRQCIESWRYNSRVMPDYMVDRLKQRVMDQKPIAQITDAITCFKGRKKNIKKRPYKNQNLINNCQQMKEIKMLTAIFGFKIIAKLSRPLNISLNPRLAEINKIVKEEIKMLLEGERRSRRKRIQTADEEIIDDVAGKITLWIDNILVDTNYKLLEESLRELEEEEGPALDFIDDLMDRVENICMPYIYEPSEKSIEKVESASVLSLLGNSMDDLKIQSVKQFIEDICLEVIAKVDLSFNENLDLENKIQSSIDEFIDDYDEDAKKNYKENIQTMLEGIVSNAIVDEFQIQEKVGGNNDTEVEFSNDSNLNENAEKLPLHLKSDENENYGQDDALDFTDENKKVTDQNLNDQLISSLDEENDDSDPIKTATNTNYNEVEGKTNIEDEQKEIEKTMDIENGQVGITENNQKIDKPEALTEFEALSETNKLKEKEESEENEELPKVAKSDQQNIDDDLKFSDAEDGEIKLTIEDIDKTNKDVTDLAPDAKELEAIDDDTEDSSKKVKFSNIDMGLGINTLEGTKDSAQEALPQLSSDKLDIDLGPRNDNLLSPADETWPQHLPLPSIKVTESVNKSVTSLGKIFETDEQGKSTNTSSYDSVSDIFIDHQQFTSMPFQTEKEIDGDKKSLELKKREKDSKTKIGKKKLPDKNNNKSDHVMKNRDRTQNVIRSKSQGSVKSINKVHKIPKKSDKELKNKISQENSQRNNVNEIKTKRITNISKDFKRGLAESAKAEGTEIKTKGIKKEQTLKSDYKKPKKILNAMGRNKERKLKVKSGPKSLPTGKETKSQKIGNIMDNDAIFKWCKGLENVIDNLETWNAWMNSTCACIKYLKQKGKVQSPRSIEKARKKWKVLHKSIKQDRILWQDMKRRNRDGLNSYKKYYYENASKTECEICDCSNI